MYKIGDLVEVNFEKDGWLAGVVREEYPRYGFHGGELKFEIHGLKKPYITITSPRIMRHLTKRAPDLWESAPLPALSTPEADLPAKHCPRPPTRR